MQIPGHLAIAIAQHGLMPRSKRQGRFLVILMVASLFPDVLDKTIGYGLKIMPNGRHYGHNIFSLIGLSLLAGFIWGKMIGCTWFVGYLGHLLADSTSFVPWFFPLKEYKFLPGKLTFNPFQLVRETMFLILTLILYRFRV